jgi:hypothetical protein
VTAYLKLYAYDFLSARSGLVEIALWKWGLGWELYLGAGILCWGICDIRTIFMEEILGIGKC